MSEPSKIMEDLLNTNPEAASALTLVCADLHRTVDRFKAFTARQMHEHPEWWEMPMSEGQWFEDFMAFQTGGADPGEPEAAPAVSAPAPDAARG